MSGKEEYSDIFNHPHHISNKRPQMTRLSRAAQFSPFAALVGYDDLVAESARITDQKRELCDDDLALLNEELTYLQSHISEHPEITIFYFEPDMRKTGGAYREYSGKVKRIKEYEEVIEMNSGLIIPFSDIAFISRQE